MKTKLSSLITTLCFLGATAGFAADPWMGTWKLNESKSKLARGMGKNHTVVYQETGKKIKVIVDGVDKDGKATHNEWTGKFDGKDYPATGPIWPSGWTCSIAKNGAQGLDVTWKKDGKVMYKDIFTASTDGKVLTDVGSAPVANEQIKAIYERQ